MLFYVEFTPPQKHDVIHPLSLSPLKKMDHLYLSFSVLLFTSCRFTDLVQATEFTIVNECRSTIWPTIVTTGGGTPIAPSGFILKSNESKILTAPKSWRGQIWGRTDCVTNNSSGRFSCVTGDCNSGTLESTNSCLVPPTTTLAEFALNQFSDLDFYDVSLVEGFNLPMRVETNGGKTGQKCHSPSCIADLNAECPRELRLDNKNRTVGCNSACNAFGTQVHCCTGRTCEPTLYSSFFKNACPDAYSYAKDDSTSTFTCSLADYSIIFCPANTSTISRRAFGAAPPPALGPVPFVPIQNKPRRNWIRFFLGAVAAVLVLVSLLGLFWCRRRNLYLQVMRRISGVLRRKHKGNVDSHFFSYKTIEIATNCFSDESLLGRGGYGPVYKGKLLNGQEIAVKRLQKMSGHGIEQFKNEVNVILNLQHRNLVRLLGYCTENEERILIYEYLPNKSLDSLIFDPEKRTILGWKSRLQIIEGIAQGLLYLHKYSRLKIIHRDLKASNILLDKDLNPKISDFGTAKIFGDDESYANTNRIVGTYGYMAPEYAMDGVFSMKSDVFSFGVMMLEIISGKKNTSFYNSDRHINLLAYVWDLWNEERVLEIKDPNLVEAISIGEVVRYVQVGLLCVQENAGDRPNMSEVVSMLQKESMSLAAPKQPSFTAILSVTNANLCKNAEHASLNMLTISDVNGR